MNKLFRIVRYYLLFGFPFVIAFIFFAYLNNHDSHVWQSTLRSILSVNLMLWISFLFIFLVMLVFMPMAREKTLRHLANLKERDEREQYITGKAARVSYIASLSLMILLFFISIVDVQYRPIIENQGIPNKPQRAVEISVGFRLFDPVFTSNQVKSQSGFTTENSKLSTSAVILILMCWQLFIFNLAAKREQID